MFSTSLSTALSALLVDNAEYLAKIEHGDKLSRMVAMNMRTINSVIRAMQMKLLRSVGTILVYRICSFIRIRNINSIIKYIPLLKKLHSFAGVTV